MCNRKIYTNIPNVIGKSVYKFRLQLENSTIYFELKLIYLADLRCYLVKGIIISNIKIMPKTERDRLNAKNGRYNEDAKDMYS